MNEDKVRTRTMDDLNTVVRVMYGTGDERGLALVVGACDAPQFLLRDSDGHDFWWRQDLCRGAKESAEAAYWKARAEAAEKKLADLKTPNALSTSR